MPIINNIDHPEILSKLGLTMKISKNKRAEELVGLRKEGTPVFMPHELGYACPICNASDEVNLDFSEYNGFMYCHKCNLDIPSCLCVKYFEPNLDRYNELPIRDRIIKATNIYLDCMVQFHEKEKKK